MSKDYLLQVGDVFELKIDDFILLDNKDAKRVDKDNKELMGRYVATKCQVDGGWFERGYSYPHGHHVFAMKMDGSVFIDFYQTGTFRCMISNRKPVAKAVCKWVITSEDIDDV